MSSQLGTIAQGYIFIYSVLSLTCFALIAFHWRALQIFTRGYWRFILTPTKIGIYVVGTVGLVAFAFIRPHTYWDVPIALFQPLLAFLFAPWSVAVFCKRMRGETTSFVELFVASCLMLIAASWAVELYIALRDGRYMIGWVINLVSGIAFYLVVGLLWNVDWREKQNASKFWLEN